MSHAPILELRTMLMLPEEDLGFSKPAVRYRTSDGTERTKVSHKYSSPEPELARRPGDPGYWKVESWLPPDATVIALVPDPDGPAL